METPSLEGLHPGERMLENITIYDFELTTEGMASIDGLDRGENGRVGPDPDIYEG